MSNITLEKPCAVSALLLLFWKEKQRQKDLTSTVCSGSCGRYLKEIDIMHVADLQDTTFILIYFNTNSN